MTDVEAARRMAVAISDLSRAAAAFLPVLAERMRDVRDEFEAFAKAYVESKGRRR